MKKNQTTKALGRGNGQASSKGLLGRKRKAIASLRGQIEDLSAKAVERIERNFKYLALTKELRRAPRPKSVSRVNYPLPK